MFAVAILFLGVFFIFRIAYLIGIKSRKKLFKSNAKTLIVIGSGGHTTEMIKQLKTINPKLYQPRLYVMADVDTSSEHKILELEKQNMEISKTDYEIVKIPRSRTVNQSYFTSVFSTLYSILKSIPVVAKFKPDLILCNGPGVWEMPLKGIKVLELAGLAPAPFCGAILADFGASVIRVDRTATTDVDCLRNGKKSLALNLKDERGKEIFKKLSLQSDVLIEPFRKGVMENLGLGPKVLMEKNPRLIYARLTGFGQNGPYSAMAGHDINFLSISGVLSFLGRKNQNPTFPANLLADFGGGGLTCAFGILLALMERNKSGKGQVIDCSMVEGAAYLSSWLFRSQHLPIWGNERGNNILDTGAHFYDTYKTKDNKYLAVGAIEGQFYKILIEKLKSDELKDQWLDFDSKKEILAKIFETKTRDEWCKIFDGTDACVTPVLDRHEVDEHPQNKERKSFMKLDGGLVAPNPAPKLSRTPGVSVANVPLVENGAHTEEILLEMGYDKTEIKELSKDGVIKTFTTSKL